MEGLTRTLRVEQGDTLPAAPPGHRLLFGFRFGAAAAAGLPGTVPALGLRPIGDSAGLEAWWYRGEVEQRRVGRVAVAECDDFVAAVHQVADTETRDIRAATRQVYDELLGVVDALGPLTIVRAWNYFSRINEGVGDAERYRQFSIGRAESFEASGLVDTHSPPGTAIGGVAGCPFTVVLLAARHPCRLVENPRQMSAFQYPPDYGPRSPKFSRGGVVSLPCGGLFLISGTAAIVGHASCRTEGIEGQAAETFRNLESLLRSAGLADDLAALDAVRVYLRDRRDLEPVRRLVDERFGAETHVTYLEGDICRAELDLEIDGVVFA
jgi:chorismate lyase/3-hydroxybenzoate synthase